MNKSPRITTLVQYLLDKYGSANIIVHDHWEADLNAIGLTDKSGTYLAYISVYNQQDNSYFVSLENPPVNDDLPYSQAGDFDKISLSELEAILTRHLRLKHSNFKY